MKPCFILLSCVVSIVSSAPADEKSVFRPKSMTDLTREVKALKESFRDAENYLSYKGLDLPDGWEIKPILRLKREDTPKRKERFGRKPMCNAFYCTGPQSLGPKKQDEGALQPTYTSKNLTKQTVRRCNAFSCMESHQEQRDGSLAQREQEEGALQPTNTSKNLTIHSVTRCNASSCMESHQELRNGSLEQREQEEGALQPTHTSKNLTIHTVTPVPLVPEYTTAPNIPKNYTNDHSTEMPVKSVDGEQPTDDDEVEDEDEDNLDIEGDDMDRVKGFETVNTTEDHGYYTSLTIRGDEEAQQYWVNLDTLDEEVVIKNEILCNSYRQASTISLTFDFPFYGHIIRNIAISTGGFLFTGDFVHARLAATQYIAPLMANFDTSVSEDACLKYIDSGTAFTVQWDNVMLKTQQDAGTFTFQATLHYTGDITFTYKQIPVTIASINSDPHPVQVGLSDAFLEERTINNVRRKTIFEYHKIDMKKTLPVGNWTAIIFKALPTCLTLNSCDACLSTKISFQCNWCNKIGRCSTGLDRYLQHWMSHGCDSLSIQDRQMC